MTTQINQKTHIPLAWAASIIMTIVGVVFSSGIQYSKIHDLQEKVAVQQIAQTVAQQADHGHDLAIQQLKLTLRNVDQGVQQINRKLDKWEKR